MRPMSDLDGPAAQSPDAEREQFEDLLASIWPYVPWNYVTSQLTTEEKDQWADAIDAAHARMDAVEPGIPSDPVERWWRA